MYVRDFNDYTRGVIDMTTKPSKKEEVRRMAERVERNPYTGCNFSDAQQLAQALLDAYKREEGLVDALVWLSFDQNCKCWCRKPVRPSERMGVPHDATCERVGRAFLNHALLQGKDSR